MRVSVLALNPFHTLFLCSGLFLVVAACQTTSAPHVFTDKSFETLAQSYLEDTHPHLLQMQNVTIDVTERRDGEVFVSAAGWNVYEYSRRAEAGRYEQSRESDGQSVDLVFDEQSQKLLREFAGQ